MIRVLIVDDEPIARETLRLCLEGDREVTVVGSCSGADAAAIVRSTPPDIMFLDVQMPEVNGFDLIEQIGTAAVPVIVFVTAYNQYALRAFDVHALDYLLKPFDDRRFQDALARAKRQLRARASSTIEERLLNLLEEREKSAQPYLHRFVVRARERSILVPAEAVDWINGADDYVELHVGKDTHLLRERLRISRAASIAAVRPDSPVDHRQHRSGEGQHALFRGDSLLVLTDGVRLRLSRSRRAEFERRLTSSPRAQADSPQMR